MATTTNLGLEKPVLTSTNKIREDINANSDLIDAQFAATYLAPQAKNAVAITGGSITGITDLVVSDGGTGVGTLTDGGVLLGSGTSPITAMAVLTDGQMIVGNGTTDPVAESGAILRASIGVTIGTHVQAYDATLLSIAALGTVANKIAYTTNTDVWAETALTAFGRSILDDADEATFKATVNLEIGTDVLAQQTIGIADNNLLEVDGLSNANEYARFTVNGLVGRTEAEFKGDFNLEIGTDVQAYDAGLLSLAGLTYASDSFIKVTATDVYAIRTLSEVRTDLGLVIGTNVLAEQTIGIANDNLVEIDHAAVADDDYAKFTANGLEGRSYSETRGDIGAAASGANADITSLTALTGGQIAFPATQVPSANANTLDDYEEGSWTMGVSFGGGTTGITYGSNTGYYTKMGNIVTISGYMALSSKGTDTGPTLLTGLPFTVVNNVAGYASVAFSYIANITFANQVSAFTDANTTTAVFNESTEAGVMTALTDANFANNSILVVNCTYRIE